MSGNVRFSDRQLFVIFDKVAESWIGQPIVEKHPAAACRLFTQLLGDKNTTLSSHPKDYVLLHVGSVDDAGVISPRPPEVVLAGEVWYMMNSGDPAQVPLSLS